MRQMQKDRSREKSLYFLLLAVARQLQFVSTDQTHVRAAINNIIVEEEDEAWVISTNVNGEYSQTQVAKTNFKFYQTREIEPEGTNPAEKNKQSAVETLLRLFEPYGFTSNSKKVKTKNKIEPTSFVFRSFFMLIGLAVIQLNEFDFPNTLLLIAILIVITLTSQMKWTFDYLLFLLVTGFLTYFAGQTTKVNLPLAIIFLFFTCVYVINQKMRITFSRSVRVIATLVASVFYFLTANDANMNLWAVVFLLMINEFLEIQSRVKRELFLLASTFAGFLVLIALAAMQGNLSIAKVFLVLGLETYLVFYGGAQSMGRFFLPPALLLVL
jgi:hypothetical protein